MHNNLLPDLFDTFDSHDYVRSNFTIFTYKSESSYKFYSSLSSLFSLAANMEAFSEFSLSLTTSLTTNFPVLGSILFSKRGPEMAIARAPIGAVMMMERTAVVRTLVPHSIISGLFSFMAASRASPPMAAWYEKTRYHV